MVGMHHGASLQLDCNRFIVALPYPLIKFYTNIAIIQLYNKSIYRKCPKALSIASKQHFFSSPEHPPVLWVAIPVYGCTGVRLRPYVRAAFEVVAAGRVSHAESNAGGATQRRKGAKSSAHGLRAGWPLRLCASAWSPRATTDYPTQLWDYLTRRLCVRPGRGLPRPGAVVSRGATALYVVSWRGD